MSTSGNNHGTAYLVYDGDCPFCSRYVRYLRLRESLGSVELVNARTEHPVVGELMAKGFNLDEGMAFVDRGKIYHGDECIHRLALLSTSSRAFNRINAAIFRSKTLSSLLYPVLKAGRNATLRILGRSRL